MEGCLPECGGQERSWGEAQVEHSFLVTLVSTPPSPHTSTLIQLFCQGRHYLHGGAEGGGPARLHTFTLIPPLHFHTYTAPLPRTVSCLWRG